MENNIRKKVLFVLLLGGLTSFGPLSMDMYLPALPIVTSDLSATPSLTQLSLTACLLGLAIGQLIFGPLSDILGRRKPLTFTLIIYSISSLLCAFSPSITIFIILRFIQGLSGAAGIVIARASARDMYSGKDLTKFIALLALVNGAAPILSPIFGGIILNYTTWHSVFIILSGIGVVMFVAVFFLLQETLPQEKRTKGNIFSVLFTFKDLLNDRAFMGIALTQMFIMTSMFAYIAGSPFILQNIYDVSAQQFSFFFAINGIGIIIAAQVTGRLSATISEVKLLHTGIIISFLGSIFLIIVIALKLPLTAIAIALFFIVSSVGVVSTTCFSLAMENQGHVAGSASAFLGLLPFAGGAIVSPLVGILGDATALPLAMITIICSISALLLHRFFIMAK